MVVGAFWYFRKVVPDGLGGPGPGVVVVVVNPGGNGPAKPAVVVVVVNPVAACIWDCTWPACVTPEVLDGTALEFLEIDIGEEALGGEEVETSGTVTPPAKIPEIIPGIPLVPVEVVVVV